MREAPPAGDDHPVDLEVRHLGLGAGDHQGRLDHGGELSRHAHDRVGDLLRRRVRVAGLAPGGHVGLGELHLLGLACGRGEGLLDRFREGRSARHGVAREDELAALLDRDVEVFGPDVDEKGGLVLGVRGVHGERVEEGDAVRTAARNREAAGGERLDLPLEVRVAGEGDEDRVLAPRALRVGEVELAVVRGDVAPGLAADLVDLEFHQVAEPPLRHRRHLAVADDDVTPRQSDGSGGALDAACRERAAGHSAGLVIQAVGEDPLDDEALALAPELDGAQGVAADGDAETGRSHGRIAFPRSGRGPLPC